jgi:hypothetical protein
MKFKLIAASVLALPFILHPAVGEAQQKKQPQYSKKQVNEMEVRHECVLKAQAMHPGIYASGDGTMNQRTSAYASCVAEKGVRP